MTLEYIWACLNLSLIALLALRLQLHRTGILTLGFINIFTALLPQYGLSPLYQLISQDMRIFERQFAEALLVVSIMLGAMLVGTLAEHKRVMPVYSTIREFPISLNVAWALFGVMAAGPILIRAWVLGTYNLLELTSLARTVEFREVALRTGWVVYALQALQGGLIILQALLVAETYRRWPTGKGFRRALLVTATTALVLMPSGSRSTLLAPILIFLFLTEYFYRRVPRSLLLGLALLAVPVIVLFKFFATGARFDLLLSGGSLTNVGFVLEAFARRVMQGFGNVVDFLRWAQGQPFGFGITILQLVVRPIPRAWYPDKPSSFDVFMSREVWGTPETLGGIHIYGGVSEMYYNFWLIGVAVWFFLLGRLLYRVHFGSLALFRDKRSVAAALVVSNGALLRGLGNLGVNTIAMQNLLLAIGAQVVFLMLLKGMVQAGPSPTMNTRIPRQAEAPP